jgi:hypothetical protein
MPIASYPTPASRLLGRRHLAFARALLVAALSALVVVGFLFDVSGAQRPAAPAGSSARLSS